MLSICKTTKTTVTATAIRNEMGEYREHVDVCMYVLCADVAPLVIITLNVAAVVSNFLSLN